MAFTVQQLLTDAMGLINTIAIDETPEATEFTVALRVANTMLGSWSVQHLMLRADTSTTFNTVAGTAQYTIGLSGATITANKYIRITGGRITDNSIDYEMESIAQSMYDSLSSKSVSSGRPIYVAYDAGLSQQSAHKGTISLYYEPDKAYSCTVDGTVYLTELASLSDTFTFEPGYYEAFVYNLAKRLFRHYHDNKVQVPADISEIAHNSMSVLKTMNHQPVTAGFDFPTNGGYNIYTDGY